MSTVFNSNLPNSSVLKPQLPNTLELNGSPKQKLDALDVVIKSDVSRHQYLQACEAPRFNKKTFTNGYSYGSFYILRRAQRQFVDDSFVSKPLALGFAAIGFPLVTICALTPPLYWASACFWSRVKRDSITDERIIKIRIKEYLSDYNNNRLVKGSPEELEEEKQIYMKVEESVAARPWKTSRSFAIYSLMRNWRNMIHRNEKYLNKIEGKS